MSHNDESGDQSVELCEICNSNYNVTKRLNKDRYVNNRGKRLIELCNSIHLHIMNGRYGADKGIGKNTSVVDYNLISENLAPYVEKFDILEFDCIISDIHCPVNAVFNLVLEKEYDLSNKTLHTRSEHVIKTSGNQILQLHFNRMYQMNVLN